MNPGNLNERGSLLRLVGESDLQWTEIAKVWMQVKETGRKNIFSKVGIGADGVELRMRARDLTLHDAVSWNGTHYFLTNITREGRRPVYLKVQAARVPAQTVTVYRKTVVKGTFNQAQRELVRLGSFPGCLTEKYSGMAEEMRTESHLESRVRLIIAAPKQAVYQVGDLLEISGKKYRIMVVHDLESWKIDYEAERIEDD